MKAFLRWLGRVVGSAITIVLVIIFFPYLSRIAEKLMPDESGAAIRTSAILASRLENSARLETLKVAEDGVLNYDIQAAFLGSVANINVSYQYVGSFGVDLKKVQMQAAGNTITFILPDPELIQDDLIPAEVHKNDFWYPGFSEMDYERLLEKEKNARREVYLAGEKATYLWNSSVEAFQSVVEVWMKEIGGHLTFRYERAAEAPPAE